MEIKIIDLPKIVDPRGNLTVAEALTKVPFDIKPIGSTMFPEVRAVVVMLTSD